MQNRGIAHTSPYGSGIYRKLLLQITQRSNKEFVPFRRNGNNESRKTNYYARHDVDTDKCMENLGLLLSVDRDVNIPAGIYFRVDDKEYSLKDHKDIVCSYRDLGFEIGLHTSCYTKDDYLSEFRRETDKFIDELGFQPKSFSVHGLGEFRSDVRMQFYDDISRRFGDFDYEFGDIPQLRTYGYVIQDCYLDENKNRFIYDDFFYIPEFLHKGENCLILTHPCYWVP